MSIWPTLRETKMKENSNHSGIAPREEVKYSGQIIKRKVVTESNCPECVLTGNVGPNISMIGLNFKMATTYQQVILSFSLFILILRRNYSLQKNFIVSYMNDGFLRLHFSSSNSQPLIIWVLI